MTRNLIFTTAVLASVVWRPAWAAAEDLATLMASSPSEVSVASAEGVQWMSDRAAAVEEAPPPGLEPGLGKVAPANATHVDYVFTDRMFAPRPASQPRWQPINLLESDGSGAWDRPTVYLTAVRGGWWAVDHEGSPVKTGEFQDLESSPFWDADGLWTDGRRTLDFFATGLDQEGNQAALTYFGPGLGAKVRYNRYLRRLDHDPLENINDVRAQTPGGDRLVKEDLDVGRDYAYRVQQFETAFQGALTPELKWRLRVWGMRKKGERQASALAHGFTVPNGMDINGNPIPPNGCQACHLRSQGQEVDWLTTEIEPALEATIGPHVVEYSRTMRTFSQSDEIVTRPYNRFGFTGELPYAAVPENYTEIDRVKWNTALTDDWDFYANAHNGNTLNRTRQTNRRLWGYDLRSTLRTSESSLLTGYAKKTVQTGQLPQFLLVPENAGSIRRPLNYDLVTSGIQASWRPYQGEASLRQNLRLTGGYEYRGLARENAVFRESSTTVIQSQTTANWLHTRAEMRWTPAIQSHVGYKLGFVDDPLYGLAKNGTTNSNRATEAHIAEVGGTWTPAETFLLTALFGLENRWNFSDEATFTEDSYPITLTAWWAPTDRWSVTGGLGLYSNWIDQDITLGALSDPVTTEWNYSARNTVFNLGSTYRWTDRTTLIGGFEFVRGRNSFESLPLWPDLPLYSDVLVDVTRWTAGVDHELRPGIDAYFRYQLFDYDDLAADRDSGRSNMFLGGVSAIY